LPRFLSTALRLQFIIEKDLAEIREAEATQEVRICLECPNRLSKYLRYCCSGERMTNEGAG
jgi:hypothetical protein